MKTAPSTSRFPASSRARTDDPVPDPAGLRKPTSRKKRTANGIRLRRDSGAGGKRHGGPATPLLKWKVDVDDDSRDNVESGGEEVRSRSGAGGGPVSARKLAAGLWRVHSQEGWVSGEGGDRNLSEVSRNKIVHGESANQFLVNSDGGKSYLERKERSRSPASVPHMRNNLCYRRDSSVAFPNAVMERATKWDPGCRDDLDEVKYYNGLKMFEEHHERSSSSALLILQSELDLARTRVHELESERRSYKKKIEQFVKKVSEEKAAWRSREHEKIRLVIDGMKEDFNRERKKRQHMKLLNKKLVNELTEAKLTAKRFAQDYEKERKARELMEEVCDELAKEIGEDKAEVEALKRETMKVREEVDEERKMLQMAEVWREERVQMKLIDAKIALEEKFSQMKILQAEMEAFVKLRGNEVIEKTKEAESILNAVDSIQVQDVKEFSYQPPTSDDLLSAFEDLQSGEANEKEIEACYGYGPDVGCYSPLSRNSKMRTVSPETHGLDDMHTREIVHQNGDLEEDGSVWESGSQEEQGSSNSLDGSDPSVNGHNEGSHISGSGTEWEENADNISLTRDPDTTYSAPGKQSKKKPSTISRLWRTHPNIADQCKAISVEMMKGRISNGTLSPDRVSGDGVLTPSSMYHWSSPDGGNPHITQGMKGCIEWPRGIQKNSLKAKLLEARMECQKIQLKHALKQKI